MTYDLKIRGARIVDGSAGPSTLGDVGVTAGRIVDVGSAPDDAPEVIDAEGRVVAPGFVDIHTHLDAQALFDPLLSISSWHGVTTVIAGNCGFGIAPTRPESRDLMMRSMEAVEGLDYACLSEGLGADWGFVSFREYLAAVEAHGIGINFAAYIGHTPVRLFVMGEEATERPATEDEISRMKVLVRDALEAGAIGFSTSRFSSHIVWDGRPAPSRAADMDEINSLADALRETSRGVFMCTFGPGLSIRQIGDLTERIGRPASFAAITTGMGGPNGHRRYVDQLIEVRAKGQPVTVQISCRPVVADFSLFEPYLLTNSYSTYMRQQSLEGLFSVIFKEDTVAGKMAAYQDPGFREEFRRLTGDDGWRKLLWANMTVLDAPGHPELEQRAMLELAEERGLHPSDLLVELSLATQLTTRFGLEISNNDEPELEMLMKQDGTMLGLSDSGAHLGQICDACYPTYFLGHWVRERQAVSLEEGVAMLASRPAALFGLTDRGLLRAGYAADLVIFDPDTVTAGPPRRVRDLPAGTARLVADAVGIDAVIVNGRVLYREGRLAVDPDGPLPGAVLRSSSGTTPSDTGDADA